MRFLAIAFAVIAVVRAATLPADYLPPVVDNSLPVQEYLAPVTDVAQDQTVLADDGYRYKAVHRLKLRHRRDVNELPENEYLPPAEEVQESAVEESVEPAAEVKTDLADDGYRYKTVRRLKYRNRRDVDEVPQNEYLPPTEEAQESVVAEVAESAEPAAEEGTELAADGYRYKTVRRLKYRKRRDVDEVPQNEYLPPTEEAQESVVAEVAESAEPAAEEGTELAADGYRYKTVRRLKYRKRRDVDEVPQNEYLPPTEEAQESVIAEVAESAEPAAEEGTELAADGYRYKTVRRLKYRKRRDVDEVPQNEYLPPTEEAQESVVAEVAESAEPAAEEGTELAADGYRYKTVRRLKYRKRRDVDEVPQNEYLPPTEEAQESVVAEVAEPTEPAAEEGTELASDGYRYKTVRRLKYRKRRDVDEVPQNEYLPPTEEAQESAVSDVAESAEPAAEEGTELAADGYRYKTVRRLKYRKRRDVDEVPQNEYLPPTEEAEESVVAEVAESAEPAAEEGTELAADGYRYKTVRRLKYRKRRDVDEVPQNEYLPPTEEAQESVVAEVAESAEPAAEEGTELAADGYRYKTVRRLKYRKRRDVDEVPQNEYLPPTEEAQESVVAEVAESAEPAAEEGTELAADGYRYKTVRRLKYRKRRDVDEVPQNEYLPPTEEAQESVVAEVAESAEPAAEEGTELAADGYRYKTVRRLKYRKRRDVDEVPQNEYLPPTEEAQESVVAEVAESAEPAAEEGTELAADGYRYKTVRRLKYRKRRDVDEVPQNEYLPPTEEAQESVVAEVPESAEPAAEEGTELAADGYRYKTVRRLKYRKRRDVDEVPQNEYLPPTEEAQESVVAEVAESAEPAAEEGTELAADGYRYKTVRRLKYRKRRDVDEVPQNEYLPPTEEAQESVVADVAESAEPAAEEGTELAADGYRYKTVRRLKYRKRRDVDEVPQNEYLPPTEEAQESVVAEVAESAEPVAEEGTELAADGYRYKTVRRLKYRKRRDVDEVPQNEYLPPTEEAQESVVAEVAESAEPVAEEGTELAADGYRYKTVRRLKYRKRRDVDEVPQNEYLPPVEEAQETAVTEVAEPTEPAADDATVLADDGYRYKVVRRLKYRHRRDVNELPANEYLPPTEEGQEVAEQQPEEETAALADDGYRYKTVRRLKYRRH